MKFYIFRHGLTDWNSARRIQGHHDTALNVRGLEQADALASYCTSLEIHRVVSSDLTRAATTGRRVAEALGVPIELTPALREAHMGEIQGMTIDEVRRELGDELLMSWFRYEDTPEAHAVRFPGGESRGELIARVQRELERLVAAHAGEILALSTHGGVIGQVLSYLCPEAREELAHVPNTSLHELHHDGGRWRYAGCLFTADA